MAAIGLRRDFSWSGHQEVLLSVAVVTGFLAFVAAVFSSRRIFLLWTKIGQIVNKCISGILFSACYLFVVPFFVLFYKLSILSRQRHPSDGVTFWLERKNKEIDLDFFRRMG
ncbi:MAG: hypothetical protein A2036_01385 [Omnitrophica bacterium GWA2_50_21]|nr:MAG: hypothetical protein A2036_01385 [Omnitrophica bacterium GWA2_50_21]